MAITYNRPVRDWYFETTSKWTLDYPPLFAIFELFLATIAAALNLNDALLLTSQPIRTDYIVYYQKLTVIASDCLYYYAIYRLCSNLQKCIPDLPTCTNKSQCELINPPQQTLCAAIFRPDATSRMALLLLAQPALLMIDHIHFQYNGFLSGVLLLSVACIVDGRPVEASLWFALLLNMKHIYLYCAPAFGIYLLVSYCLAKSESSGFLTCLKRFVKLGSVIIMVFIATYAPFCDYATMKQIFSRLFPFKRGLTHAYWAPNFWSLYNLADKILAIIFKDSLKVNFDLESLTKSRTMIRSTSGRVGEFEHQFLPSIKPVTTFILVALFLIPVVTKLLLSVRGRAPKLFLEALTICSFISFMFGWHVHEKAIILVLLPIIPLGCTDDKLRAAFLRLTLAGTYSLFPLVYQPAEYVTKLTLLVAYYSYVRSQNKVIKGDNNKSQASKYPSWFSWNQLYTGLDLLYIIILTLSELYFLLIFGRNKPGWLGSLARLDKYEYLPLMMTSTLSAAGVFVSFIEIYCHFLFT